MDALESTKEKLKEYSNVKYIHANHDEIKEVLKDLQIQKVDGILLDLGLSSYQLDEKKERGFSYLGSNELDMRMDKSQQLNAKIVVNTYPEEELARIIYEYGEEKFSRNIAKKYMCSKKKQGNRNNRRVSKYYNKIYTTIKAKKRRTSC